MYEYRRLERTCDNCRGQGVLVTNKQPEAPGAGGACSARRGSSKHAKLTGAIARYEAVSAGRQLRISLVSSSTSVRALHSSHDQEGGGGGLSPQGLKWVSA